MTPTKYLPLQGTAPVDPHGGSVEVRGHLTVTGRVTGGDTCEKNM